MLQRYKEIRDQVAQGNLKIFRNELIHVLYKKYITYTKAILSMICKEETVSAEPDWNPLVQILDMVLKFKSDFCTEEFPIYKKELTYFEQVLKGIYRMPVECIKLVFHSDARFQAILSDSRKSSPDYLLFVSQYAFNILESIDKQKRVGGKSNPAQESFIEQINEDLKRNIRVANSLTLEAYCCCPYISLEMGFEEIQKINSLPYSIGLLRDDFVYFTKLEDLCKKKMSKDDPQRRPSSPSGDREPQRERRAGQARASSGGDLGRHKEGAGGAVDEHVHAEHPRNQAILQDRVRERLPRQEDGGQGERARHPEGIAAGLRVDRHLHRDQPDDEDRGRRLRGRAHPELLLLRHGPHEPQDPRRLRRRPPRRQPQVQPPDHRRHRHQHHQRLHQRVHLLRPLRLGHLALAQLRLLLLRLRLDRLHGSPLEPQDRPVHRRVQVARQVHLGSQAQPQRLPLRHGRRRLADISLADQQE